jgi:hypothetical protein
VVKLQRKDGSPTAFGYQCGQVTDTYAGGWHIALFYEHGAYHVLAYNAKLKHRSRMAFEHVNDARKEYRNEIRIRS